jgi:hypothetical protein
MAAGNNPSTNSIFLIVFKLLNRQFKEKGGKEERGGRGTGEERGKRRKGEEGGKRAVESSEQAF